MIGDPRRAIARIRCASIRVVRFAAKLGFEIEPEDARPDPRCASLLETCRSRACSTR
jgi:tRNA nucleotidyltransferase/poly(A) polymerase